MKRSRPWLLAIHCANHRMYQNFSLSLAQEFGQITESGHWVGQKSWHWLLSTWPDTHNWLRKMWLPEQKGLPMFAPKSAKFKSYTFMCISDIYLDLLEKIARCPWSSRLKSLCPPKFLWPRQEPWWSCEKKQGEIGTVDEFLDSYVTRYTISETGVCKVEFVKARDKRKKNEN